MSKIRLLAAFALLIGSVVLIAADRPAKPAVCPAPVCPACSDHQRAIYPVADLVIPVTGMTGPFPGMAGVASKCELDGICCAGFDCPLTCSPPESKTNEANLLKLITGTCQPACWTCAGGNCKIDYSPVGMALVVSAPEAMQQRVAALLDTLRKLQDVNVTFEMRIVTVPQDFFEQFGLDLDMGKGQQPRIIRETKNGIERVGLDFECCDGERCGETNCKTRAVPITDIQAHLLLEAVQGDRRACVMQAPKLTTLNGQQANICVQDQQTFVTGVTVEATDDQPRIIPKNKTVRTGLNVSVLPMLSADRRFVSLHLQADHTYQVSSTMPLIPVATQIAPIGGKGSPVSFTQYIQQPKFNTLTCDTRFVIPDGGTMLIDAGKIERDVRIEKQIPVLGKVPYVNRLFRNISNEHVCERLLVLVTPRIICSEPESACHGAGKSCCEAAKADCCDKGCCEKGCCEKCAKPAKIVVFEEEESTIGPVPAAKAATKAVKSAVELRAEKIAAKLVQKYHEACANGEPEMARKYGRQALDLDPECFGKTIFKQTYQPMPQPPEISRELSKSRGMEVFDGEIMQPTTYRKPVVSKWTSFDEVRQEMVPEYLRPLGSFEKPRLSNELNPVKMPKAERGDKKQVQGEWQKIWFTEEPSYPTPKRKLEGDQ
jgi:hypothetical protein